MQYICVFVRLNFLQQKSQSTTDQAKYQYFCVDKGLVYKTINKIFCTISLKITIMLRNENDKGLSGYFRNSNGIQRTCFFSFYKRSSFNFNSLKRYRPLFMGVNSQQTIYGLQLLHKD